MKVTLKHCPYCGSSVSELNSETLVCQGCGKRICADRDARVRFVLDNPQESVMSLQALMDDKLYAEALKRVDQIVDEMEEDDRDILMLRGAIQSYLGEDGKAFNDWKKAMQMQEDHDDIDSYMCIICKSIANMIYLKESEFVEFDFIRYIDRVAQIFSEICGTSLKAFTFYTVYVNYVHIGEEKAKMGEDPILYIIPRMFRNVVVYYRNYPNLRHIVESYLELVDYDVETYDEDGMEQCHLYDVVSQSIDRHCKMMSKDAVEEAIHHWNDENMSVLDEAFEEIEKYIRGKRKGDMSLETLVHSYVHRCLLLDCRPESLN